MKASTMLLFADKIEYAYTKLCEPLLEEFDLPKVSFDILMFLTNNPEYKTAHEICKIRHIKKNLVSVHVEKLVSSGYLVRGSVEGDRRKIGLTCTEKAKPVIEAGISMQKRFYELLTDGVSETDREVHQMVMEKIASNVSGMA